MTVFLHVFFTKLVKFGRTEVSIPPIDAKFQDLSIQRVVKGWFLIFGGEKSIFHSVVGRFFGEKKEVFVTKSVRKRFHELSLGRNNRLGLGTSKIEVLAKNSKKTRSPRFTNRRFEKTRFTVQNGSVQDGSCPKRQSLLLPKCQVVL